MPKIRPKELRREALHRTPGLDKKQAFAAAVIVCLALAGVGWLGWATMKMPGQSHRGPVPPPDPARQRLAAAARRHVETLAGEIGERNVFRPQALDDAAGYIEAAFRRTDAYVERQTYPVYGEECANIIAEFPGAASAHEIIVVGAHYDSVMGSPGANDNASGVAGLLELCRMVGGPQDRTVRFVAFVNEEPPFFTTPRMGSFVYAQACREAGDQIEAMICLEMLGCYSDEPQSQQYPFPMDLFYPSTGNFIGFVGNLRYRGLCKRVLRMFREEARIPSQGACLPAFIPGIDWSDHRSFWRCGYPALMVTDTALYRYPYYHTQLDTPEKIDYDRLSEVVRALAEVVERLARRGGAG